MTRDYDKAFENTVRFVDKAVEDGFELSEVVAMVLGVVEARYSLLNNHKGENAIKEAYRVFMNELT